jgi:hypothetical protein
MLVTIGTDHGADGRRGARRRNDATRNERIGRGGALCRFARAGAAGAAG